MLKGCTSLDDIQAARRFNPALRASLEPYSDEAVLTRLKSMSGAAPRRSFFPAIFFGVLKMLDRAAIIALIGRIRRAMPRNARNANVMGGCR